MIVCKKCGENVEESLPCCPYCGELVGEGFSKSMAEEVVPEVDEKVEQNDAEQNRTMAILAYLGILVWIPIFMAPNSRFVRYHCNQGLMLFLGSTVYLFAFLILSVTIFRIPVLGLLLQTIAGIGFIAFFIGTVLGIVNVLNGEMKGLPFIGSIEFLKYTAKG